jgi:hypothetical protein
MGRKPKAGSAKGKATDPEQSARFIEAARQVGVDETGEAFERAFEKIVRPKGPSTEGSRTRTSRAAPKPKPPR